MRPGNRFQNLWLKVFVFLPFQEGILIRQDRVWSCKFRLPEVLGPPPLKQSPRLQQSDLHPSDFYPLAFRLPQNYPLEFQELAGCRHYRSARQVSRSDQAVSRFCVFLRA